MSTSETVAQRAIDYLKSIDEWKRAAEVAEEIGSDTDYTRMVLNDLSDRGEVEKEKRGAIIGTSINGETYVLATREHAKHVIRTYGNLSEAEMREMSLDELRTHVEENIGDRTGPIGNKVWYRAE